MSRHDIVVVGYDDEQQLAHVIDNDREEVQLAPTTHWPGRGPRRASRSRPATPTSTSSGRERCPTSFPLVVRPSPRPPPP